MNYPSIPSSDSFWILSSGYLDAGDATYEMLHSDSYVGFVQYPCIFSYFRCIELSLKAVLVTYGVKEKTITETLGHRISDLLDECEKFVTLSEIGINPSTRTLLNEFSEDYSTKWFEYPDSLWEKKPDLTKLKKITHLICDSVQKHKPIKNG